MQQWLIYTLIGVLVAMIVAVLTDTNNDDAGIESQFPRARLY
jgi:hypothetical protein